jgi:hypothetical protein
VLFAFAKFPAHRNRKCQVSPVTRMWSRLDDAKNDRSGVNLTNGWNRRIGVIRRAAAKVRYPTLNGHSRLL